MLRSTPKAISFFKKSLSYPRLHFPIFASIANSECLFEHHILIDFLHPVISAKGFFPQHI